MMMMRGTQKGCVFLAPIPKREFYSIKGVINKVKNLRFHDTLHGARTAKHSSKTCLL